MRKKGQPSTGEHHAAELAFFGLTPGTADKDIKRAYRRMKYALPHDEDRAEVEQIEATYRYLRRKKRRSDLVS